jgi:hypothetical protein
MAQNDGHEIRLHISKVFKGLYTSYEGVFLDCFIDLWYQECKFKLYPPDAVQDERLQSIIEILLYINVSVENFLDYLPKS